MTSINDLLPAFKKSFGNTVGSWGGTVGEGARLPSGLFALDMAMGGGWPIGKYSIIYGAESSNKTNCALKTIANSQLLYPKQTCVFVDMEHSFNQPWAQALGVDTDRLLVLQPDFAEQAGDMVEGLLGSDDCGLIVIDSIAAMMSGALAEKSLADGHMGGSSVIISRMLDKIILQMRRAEKEGRPMPTVLTINQVRTKLGVVYGNPLSMPGPNKQKFAASMIVRVSGKNIMDNKISKVMPVIKETAFVIEKWKFSIIATNGVFSMVTVPHNGLGIGECDDFNTVTSILKSLGMLVKHEKSGWLLKGYHYPTLKDAEQRFYTEKEYALSIKSELIKTAVSKGVIEAQQVD